MLRNYLKIAFRNLWRNKGFSFINIVGLAIGMASAVLILLWVQNELSYDQFHEKKDRLYEVWNRAVFDNKLQCWDNTPDILGPTLKKEYPDIAEVSRTNYQWFLLNVGEKKLMSRSLMVDPSFLSMFSFPLLQGDPKTALNDLYSIVITEKTAKKFFANEDAMGKTIRLDKDNFKVTGILQDLPVNTQFDFEYLLPWDYLVKLGATDDYWGDNRGNTYVLLKPSATEAAVDAKIKDITKRHSNGTEDNEVFLHPATKWRLYSSFENGKIVGGRIGTVRIFALIAAFILLIACINFMNLSTARSERRAKEVGIRKVSGAGRGLLIAQFMGESMLITGIAGIFALLLIQLFLPAFDGLVGKALFLPFGNGYFWISVFSFLLLTGVLAGSYPAFFLSSFQPVAVLKGTFRKAYSAFNPRKVLVVLQFSFAIVLIICTFIIMQQMRYAQDRDTGYDRGRLLFQWSSAELDKKYPILKNELLGSGLVSSVTRTSAPLTERFSDTWGILWVGKAPDDKTDFDRFGEDEGLAQTAGLKLTAGRDMDLTAYLTDSTAMLLNESAVKTMGFKHPIGQIITDGNTKYHIVGVIKDFILTSPFEPTRPMIIEGSSSIGSNVINMKLKTGIGLAKSLEVIGQLFKKYNPDYPFDYHFVDEEYARKFEDTQRTATLTGLFAGLTILISCLGLFGLAAYMAQNRIKEIGVRKVLGASVFRITALLSKEFLTLVIISIVIATPLAWYFMNVWLRGYSYRIRIEWWVFVLAGAVSIFISLVTVSYQAIRAAIANPVDSLRTE